MLSLGEYKFNSGNFSGCYPTKKKFFPECYRGEKQILEFFLDVILPKKSFLDVILEPQGASRQPEGVARQRTGEQVGRDDDDGVIMVKVELMMMVVMMMLF